MSEWVVWGQHDSYGPVPLRLTSGTLPHCRQEVRWRKSDGGWNELYIRKAKTAEPRVTAPLASWAPLS